MRELEEAHSIGLVHLALHHLTRDLPRPQVEPPPPRALGDRVMQAHLPLTTEQVARLNAIVGHHVLGLFDRHRRIGGAHMRHPAGLTAMQMSEPLDRLGLVEGQDRVQVGAERTVTLRALPVSATAQALRDDDRRSTPRLGLPDPGRPSAPPVSSVAPRKNVGAIALAPRGQTVPPQRKGVRHDRLASHCLRSSRALGRAEVMGYEQSRSGRIPTVTLGRYRRYRREAIEAWLEDLEEESGGRRKRRAA